MADVPSFINILLNTILARVDKDCCSNDGVIHVKVKTRDECSFNCFLLHPLSL